MFPFLMGDKWLYNLATKVLNWHKGAKYKNDELIIK